jgi:predicted nucleic acid-binding protein
MPSMPRDIVVDTGPLVALFDADDNYHLAAENFVRLTSARLFSTMAVVTEAMYVLSDSLPARANLLTWIQRGGLTLVEPEKDDLGRIIDLIEKYFDLPMDFTDAVVVSLCERLNTPHVATVDSDFEIYRYHGRAKFINVFHK